MFPEKKYTLNRLHKSRGFGLPMAIFIVTILALLIATMSQVQESSSEGVSLQVQSNRAFYAAESGIQLALNLLLPPSGAAAACSGSLYSRSYTAPGLSGCSVAVSCTSVLINSENYYTLTSTGQCGSLRDQARRRLEVRVK